MDDVSLCAAFARLLRVCNDFAATCRPGVDIRSHGLTPELLATCNRAMAIWCGQGAASTPGEASPSDTASWRAYQGMLSEHGEDFG